VEADDQGARLVELEAKNAEFEAKNAEFEAKNAKLEAKNAKLEAKVERLLEQLGQNSRNSHLPPSSDGPGAGKKNERKPKSKSKGKRGGQKGHRGAHRQLLPPERVDQVIDVFPEVCLGCGAALPQVIDEDARRHQLLDLGHGGAHVTETRRHEVGCPCGHQTRVSCRDAKIPASPFGPRLVAVVALLTGVYHLSRRRARLLLHELFGVEVSLGAISALEARASAALESTVAEAQREVERAEVKHTDATSWVRAGALMSLWVIASATVTVYRILDNGRRETIEPLYGDVHEGILVSDRATVFGFWEMGSRQICWAHILRKFVSFSERDGPAGALGHMLLEYTSLVFEYWHSHLDGKLSRAELEHFMKPVRQQFEATLERAVAANIKRLSGSCANMLAHAQALWTFVTHEGVEPTNNHAERELRAFVLWRKRSFGSQSERGERFAERMMTVAHTLRKLGEPVLDFIADSVRARLEGTPRPSLLGA
jgi:transposase